MSEQEAFEQAITKHIVSNKLKAFALEKLPNGTYKNNFTKAKLDGWQYATTEANKRIEALEGEFAELKEKLLTAKLNENTMYVENSFLKSYINDLREALEKTATKVITDGNPSTTYLYEDIHTALATTPAESLQAHDDDVIASITQSLTDPENQPSQFGTVPLEWYENLENKLEKVRFNVSEVIDSLDGSYEKHAIRKKLQKAIEQ